MLLAAGKEVKELIAVARSPGFLWKLAVAGILVLLGGVFAGLTLALMSEFERGTTPGGS